MKEHKIIINEFPDKPRVSRYSYTYNKHTWGWYSLNRVLEELKKQIKEASEEK